MEVIQYPSQYVCNTDVNLVFYHQFCKRLHFETNVIYGLSRGIVKQRGFVAISAITALRMALLHGNCTFI